MAVKKEILSKLKGSLLDTKSGAFKVFGNLALSLILYGLEELLEKEIHCPCALKLNGQYILFTFIIPAILLFFLGLLVQKHSQMWCKSCQCWEQGNMYKRSVLCLSFLSTMVTASIPAMIWLVLLFLDGDYYSCSNLMGKNGTASMKACESTCNKNSNEIPVTLQKLCVKSQVIGGCLLIGMLAALVLIYSLQQCARRCAMESYYEFEHDCLHDEEEVILIMAELKEKAVKKAIKSCEKNVVWLMKRWENPQHG
uniref:calcium homeostasis modulator protein 6-like n=1 Tax=Pristiophorus japonicus TaxID=55135 RepID=UPI00398E9DF7